LGRAVIGDQRIENWNYCGRKARRENSRDETVSQELRDPLVGASSRSGLIGG